MSLGLLEEGLDSQDAEIAALRRRQLLPLRYLVIVANWRERWRKVTISGRFGMAETISSGSTKRLAVQAVGDKSDSRY
jgi:hypothetical protein